MGRVILPKRRETLTTHGIRENHQINKYYPELFDEEGGNERTFKNTKYIHRLDKCHFMTFCFAGNYRKLIVIH